LVIRSLQIKYLVTSEVRDILNMEKYVTIDVTLSGHGHSAFH